VWLIDKFKEMDISTGDNRVTDYGLIAYLRNFNGIFLIGDAQSPDDTLVFENMVGYMNDVTVQRYQKWHPATIADLSNSTNAQIQKNLNFGGGSQLINLQDSQNNIMLMQWANVDIKNIYARCKVYSDKTMPLFFDSELND
jgi:hypothetical protein